MAMKTKPDTLSRQQLAGLIGSLSGQMHGLADLMQVYGGFDGEMQKHAGELHGAADIAQGWAEGILDEKG